MMVMVVTMVMVTAVRFSPHRLFQIKEMSMPSTSSVKWRRE